MPELVAELVRPEHGGEVVDAEVRAEHGARLVLRALRHRPDVLALLDQADVAAAHGAGEAGAVADLVAAEHGLAVDVVDAGEVAVAEVVRGQDAHGVGVVHDLHQPFTLPQLEELVVGHVGVGLFRFPHEARQVVAGQVPASAHGDRLEVLRAEHRPDARAPGVPRPVAVDAREAHQALAADADDGDVHLVRAQALLDEAFRLEAGLARQLRERDDRGFSVVDEQERHHRGLPRDVQDVDARLPQLDAEAASHGRVAVDAGGGRDGHERALAGRGEVHARQRAPAMTRRFSGPSGSIEKSCAARLSQTIFAPNPRPPMNRSRNSSASGMRSALPGGEIDVQPRAEVAGFHRHGRLSPHLFLADLGVADDLLLPHFHVLDLLHVRVAQDVVQALGFPEGLLRNEPDGALGAGPTHSGSPPQRSHLMG